MADYQLLKEAVAAVIKQNGNQEITGDLLQSTLLAMINSLGSGYQFAGVADGAVVPGTPDAKLFYIAAAPGTYENFGGLVVNNGELAIFFMPEGTGSWYKQSAQISTSGLFFGGVIGTAASPTTDTKMFYVATEPGTYQNFNNLVVNFGEIGVFTKPTGSNVWIKQSIKINPYGFTLYSNTVYASNSLPAKPTDGGKYMILVDNVSDGFKHRCIYTSVPAVNSGNWASMLELQTIALGNDEASAAGNTPSVPSSTKLSDELAGILTEMGTKADKVVGATDGNVAELDGNGNLKDGGVPVANLAQKDGYYQSLTAGAAENLIGRGTVNAEFTRRTSGGTADIGTGAANIKKIQGKTIVWNQLVKNGNFADGITDWAAWSSSNSSLSVVNGNLRITSTVDGNDKLLAKSNFAVPNGHKILVTFYFRSSKALTGTYRQGLLQPTTQYYPNVVDVPANTWIKFSEIIITSGAISYMGCGLLKYSSSATLFDTGDYIEIAPQVMVRDLTRLGLDFTASELGAIFPLAYYDYDAGSLLNLKAENLVTTGFNQWDEEWESGFINGVSGQNAPDSSAWRSKNYIPIFPETMYYFFAPNIANPTIRARFYDAEKNYIGANDFSGVSVCTNQEFKTPANAWYMRFTPTNANVPAGTLCCLNLSWSGVRNGEYEPYEKHTLPLNLTSLTSGGTAIFPDGLKSAGSIFDEVDATKAFKRIGAVDLGSLNWTYLESKTTFYAPLTNTKANGNIKCAQYLQASPTGISAQTEDQVAAITLTSISNAERVYVRDTTQGTDAAAFKTAMSGVILYYEFATPLEYVLDSALNLSYYVNDFGTEEITPENGPVPSTAPIIYEVQYAMNAVDTLRNLPKNYISKSSMEHILTALVTAGIIAAYTLTWNATTETYDCTITPIS